MSSADPQYIDCLEDFKLQLGKLSTWDLRCLSNINKENFISVTEACDPKTDSMVGWEKCTTLNGLIAKNAIPDVTKLSDDETINLMDNLLSREFATLDGQRILLGPFACVYLHNVEKLTKGSDILHAYTKSFLASTNLLYSICGEANVLENEELMFQCQEALSLSQGTDTEAVVAALHVAASKTSNEEIKLRLQVRAKMLQTLLTIFLAHSIANSDVEAALADAAQIASDLRSKIIPDRRKRGAIVTDSKFFPNDVRYWLTTNTTSSSTEPDWTEQLEKIAAFYASLANFTAFAPCANFFEIAVVAEKISISAPCALTRPFAYAYIFRDRPTEQPTRVARGDRILGGSSLRLAVLKYLERDLGAPLYFQLLDSSVAPANNAALQDVAHYIIACSSGHTGLKAPANQVLAIQQQTIQSLLRWLDMAAVCVADSIQSSLFNTGRHQRRVANRLSELNQLHTFSWDIDQRIFCANLPQSSSGPNAREQTSHTSVLTSFATDLICDAMEKFVRLTMRLDLPTKPELIACTWYLDLIATTRIEQLNTVTVKPNERGTLIPERKVNKRNGNPLAAPALTSRTMVTAANTAYSRADVARQIADVCYMAFATFQSHGLVSGYDSAVSTSLVSVEQVFDHRFEFFGRVRVPALPPFSACINRTKQLKDVPLYRLIASIINLSTEVSELAKSNAAEAEANKSVYAEDLSNLEKSIRALSATVRLFRTLVFPTVPDNNTTEVANPAAEGIAKALANYELIFDAPYDKSIVIPLLRKKAQ